MKRLAYAALALVGCGVAGVAAAPWAIGGALAERGVTVARIGWCAEGLCLTDIVYDGARAAGAVARWDRVVRVVDVSVPLATVMARLGRPDPGASVSEGGAGLPAIVAPLVAAVDVEHLVVEGAPVPALSGRVWPTRRLRGEGPLVGEGVEIDGDTVRATMTTEVGAVEIVATPGGGGVRVDAWCRACRLPAPSAADAPLVLPDVHAEGAWAGGAFTGTVRVGAVAAGVVARRDADDAGGPTGTARVTLSDTALADVYALFGPTVPEAARARIGGTIRAEVDVAWRGGALDVEPLLDRFAVAGFTVDGLVPPGLAGGPFTFRARDAAGDETLVVSGEGTANWLSLAALGPWLTAAVLAAEDASFREHGGYDLAGMREAAAKNAEEGELVRGGSTLTQQLAKNLFLDGTRSYARKLRELLYAVEMERELGKPRILELYLNVVEFGPGLRGARAGARTYFLKEPAGLLPEEAAWLASILRFPRTAWRAQYLADRPDDRRVDWILENLRGVPEAERVAALGRPVRLVPPP